MKLTEKQFSQLLEDYGIRTSGSSHSANITYCWIPKEFGNVSGVGKDTLHAILSMVEHHQKQNGPLLDQALSRVDQLIAERDALLDEIDSLKSDV